MTAARYVGWLERHARAILAATAAVVAASIYLAAFHLPLHADLSDLLGRFGIDLIADKIEGEGSVVDLLDYDVRYGQGFLFSAPRPVRAEALQGIAERSDVVARDVAPVPERPALRPAEPTAPSTEASKGEQRTTGLAQLARGIVSRG